jgi:hypothetical protein
LISKTIFKEKYLRFNLINLFGKKSKQKTRYAID